MLPLQAKVDWGAMAMKGYSAFPKAPGLLEPHHQIVYGTRSGGGGVLPQCIDAVGVFYTLSQLDSGRVIVIVIIRGNGGARGVMVIIIGNGHGDTSSYLGRDWLHFT